MDNDKEKNCACQTCCEFIHPALHVSNIKNLIPLVLDTKKVQYSCWSTRFLETARAYNVLDHIDSTVPTPSHFSDSTQAQLNAVVLTWIYATISTDLLVTLLDKKCTTAMDAWTCLRDMFQHKTTRHKTMQCYKKQRKNNNVEGDGSDKVDFISSLPDDILVHLLSFVGIKAAARTSLLSKRWRKVWTNIVDLDFEDPHRLAIAMTDPRKNLEMGNFADWVNQVINANEAQYLNTFRMHFPIPRDDDIYASNIDKWLEFAFTKKVRNLELHMVTHPLIPFFKNPAFVLNTSLVSLYLTRVSIDGPLIQWVLSNCLHLRLLLLHYCLPTSDASSKHNKLDISSLELKHLEFFHCPHLLNTESLRINAPNLVSFLYFESLTLDVEYVSVPSLVDAAFGGRYSRNFFSNGSILSGLSSRLEKLSLQWHQVIFPASKFPTFDNVKVLELSYSNDNGEYLLVSTISLITACPLLHTFKLKLIHWNQIERESSIPMDDAQTDLIRAHRSLKVIEFVGYAGNRYATDIAYCLIRHAPMLKKFILDPRNPKYVGDPSEWFGYSTRGHMAIGRSRAKLLAEQINKRVGSSYFMSFT